MSKFLVTTGGKFIDIDGFACVLAYTELLKLEGKDAEAILVGPLNHSVTIDLRNLNMPYSTVIPDDGSFVIVDVSDPEYLARYYDMDRVDEIFDHHFGFEEYWQQKIGEKSHIAPVGSCTTLIWEAFVAKGYADKISVTSANLLAIAILSNTLNFKASVTQERDITAFDQLKQYMDLPVGWEKNYFEETEKEVFTNLQTSIHNDTKILEIKNLNKTLIIGQIELWDSKSFIRDHQADIDEALSSFNNPHWLMTSPSISEGKNYIYTKDDYIKELFTNHLEAIFTGDVGVTSKLWMRKEILKVLYTV